MKNIVVTGAGGNLGKVLVKQLAASGFQVIAFVSHRHTQVPTPENDLIEYYPVDALDTREVKQLMADMIKKHKSIDALVHLIGGYQAGKLEETALSDFQKMVALNFETAINFVQPVLMQMKNQEKGGVVVLIGSRPGHDVTKGLSSVAYGFSKSLLFRLAEMINAEKEMTQVKAKVIVPGTIDTPQNRAAMPNADFNKWNKPEEIANQIVQLCSEDNQQDIFYF